MDALRLSLRHAVRALCRRPGYSFLVVATLGLAIGADTAMFSVVETILVEPLPYRDPGRMVLLREASSASPMVPMTAAEVEHLDDHSETLESLVAFDPVSFHLRAEDGAERLPGALVTTDFFDAFGVQPAIGRGFVDADGLLEEVAPVLLTDAVWRSRYGADPGVVGKLLDMEWTAMFGPRRVLPERFEVVGVLPADFVSPWGAPEVFAPLRYPEGVARVQGSYLFPFGRLAEGESPESAKAELDVLVRALGAEQLPGSVDADTVGVTVLGLAENRVSRVRSALWMLFAAVTLVFLVACANVAGLSMVRLAERRPELSLRRALGASRARLAIGPLTESALLALGGCGLGLVVAWLGGVWLRGAGAGVLPSVERIGVDPWTVAFATVLAVATVLLFGVLPAWRASAEVGRSSARVADASRRLRSTLVAVEIALSMVLLVGAGLLMRSFRELDAVDLGFETERLLTFEVALPERYANRERRAEAQREILERLAAIPEVRSAAVTNSLPLTALNTATRIEVAGYADPDGGTPFASYREVSAELFEALGTPVLAGRSFDPTEVSSESRTIVVNRAFARRFLSGEGDQEDDGSDRVDLTSALGRSVGLLDVVGSEVRVVGVVGDLRDFGPARPVRPTVYVPRLGTGTAGFALRTLDEPERVFAAIRSAVSAVDPRLPVHQLRTFESAASRELGAPLFNTSLMVVFAVLALVLAVGGLFGLVAFSVRQRQREIGVRMALGANRANILSDTLADAARPVVVGLTLGTVAAVAAGRLFESQLYGIQPGDPMTVILSGALLALVALIAALAPARRATRVEPVSVLRDH